MSRAISSAVIGRFGTKDGCSISAALRLPLSVCASAAAAAAVRKSTQQAASPVVR